MNRIVRLIFIGLLLFSLSISIMAGENPAESDSSTAYFDKTPFKNSTMFILKMNYDLKAKYRTASVGYDVTSRVDKNISINFELLFKEIEKVRWGIGIQLQMPRSTPQIIGSFNFNSVYAHMIAYPFLENDFPYIVARVGYNLFLGDSSFKVIDGQDAELTGGLYYALGVGSSKRLKKGLVLGEILLTYNTGKVESPSSRFDARYSRLIISLGYGF